MNPLFKKFQRIFIAIAATATLSATLIAAPIIKTGDSVAFLGDSITYFGAKYPGGYARLVESGLKANGIDITVIPAGVARNTAPDMLARVDKDVVVKKPVWMTLSCGVNDVNQRVPLEAYQRDITAIVDQAQSAGIKVVILTATVVGETIDGTPRNRNTQALPYNAFLHQLADVRHLPLADLNADMQAALAARKAAGSSREFELTVDGVHMNNAGNLVMARGLLRTFGLTDAELAKAEDAWNASPDLVPLTASLSISIPENELLEKRAGGTNRDQYLNEQFAKFLKSELEAARNTSKSTP